MGGSPCKAWDWRNPIVQTLFTQGPTRTASVAHKRAGLSFGLSPRRRGCAARARWPWARAFPALDGDIPKAGFRSRGAGRGRRIMPRPGRSANVPGGAAKPPRPGRSASAPRGGGGRAEPARRGPLAPPMFGPSGRTPPPPPKGAAKPPRPGKSANVPRGGRRAGEARPAGAFGPRHVRPFGPNAAPPKGALAYRALSLAPSLVSSTP